MRKQQKIWLSEHANAGTVPKLNNVTPASGVVSFVGWLKSNDIKPPGNVIDIGCGKGRNAIPFARLGYRVWAIDYIKAALQAGEQLAGDEGVEDSITFQVAEVDAKWPFRDDFFNIAIDSFSSIDIETKQGREVYKDEMLRTLKPGGHVLVTVVSADDEWEKELIAVSPGEEKNSTIWPQNGKFQKDYDETELREFYQDFQVVDLKKLSKPTFKLEKNYIATNYWMVLRKLK